jgi:hypothetical protein
MDRSWAAVSVRSALQCFYRNEGREFWHAFENDPDAAVRAFTEHPKSFGDVQIIYDFAPGVMQRDHQRIIGLLQTYLARLRANGWANASAPKVE